MNDGIAVELRNVTKRYRLGSDRGGTLKERFLGRAKAAASGIHTALENVSFDVPAGQVLGIIGENGSGKSTILKLIAGITDPDAGTVRAAGRVSSLLEVGAGFHPDLTGRENVYLNGAILGMNRADIAARFDDIVAFAELETFIDTPVKFYSSGMYMRLGFAVGIHVNPRIMVVDEILAVGDEIFQIKCKNKIRELKAQGVTLIFVSHDLASVQEICDRCLLMDHGKTLYDGSPEDAVAEYHAVIFDRVGSRTLGPHLWVSRNRFGNQKLQIKRAVLVDSEGRERDAFAPGEEAAFVFEFESDEAHLSPLFSFILQDDNGAPVFSTDMRHLRPIPAKVPNRSAIRLRCRLNLIPGFYTFSIAAIPQEGYGKTDWLEWIYDYHAMTHGFTIRRDSRERDVLRGACFLDSHWEADWLEPYADPYGSGSERPAKRADEAEEAE